MRAEVSLSTSRVDNKSPHSESETPPVRPVEDQYRVFDGVSGRQVKAGVAHLETLPEVSALLNLEELSMKDFLAALKAGEIVEMVLPKARGVHEAVCNALGFWQWPLPREQWPLPREQCEVIDAFFVEKTKSGTVRELKPPHSMPTFCVRKPNGKWRLVHAYDKLNNATVPAQTPIPHEDVLLNNMSGCTLYNALDQKDADWVWEQQHQDAYDSIKASLQHVPVLALPDENKSFSVLLTMQ
ncbi:Pol protein [Phytophthora palmivora]|uniref:Pol protein n=1 Tax=Phytophthora palmivora TaxID=4796 RepID=A0A2P4XN31_9STRA|nr:Pol protein [Phytophthora palmivora]